MNILTMKIPEALAKRIQATAKKSGKSKSQLVRLAVEEYLKNDAEIEKLSFFDLTNDLAGSVEGPPDLSSNPNHMRGFGIK